MPTFDAGTLFLTFLFPIRHGLTEAADGLPVSHAQRLRDRLAVLPTAQHSPAAAASGQQSPFAAMPETHFCRMLVIDDVVYNGRPAGSTALGVLTQADPIQAQPVDGLATAWLVMAVDIDAVRTPGDALPPTLGPVEQAAVRTAWAERLWHAAEPQMRAVFQHCWGFEGVETAEGFARYLARGQVDTTMPFHDYGLDPAALPAFPQRLVLAPALPLAVALLGLAGLLLNLDGPLLLSLLVGWSAAATFWLGLAATGVLAAVLYTVLTRRGEAPLPPAPDSDLPSVLKSLYLQRQFADFVADTQGLDAGALHRRFGEFLASHRPEDTREPSQAPGVVQ